MSSDWFSIVDGVLRPRRPRLEWCLARRDDHLAAMRVRADERLRAIAGCEQRINEARQAVFASNDGVVSSLMTDLEREWRRLSRRDPDAEVMDYWAVVVPPSWVDRKRWRDAPADARLDVAVALAADTENVEAAEAAIDELRRALVALRDESPSVGARVRYLPLAEDASVVVSLLEEPLRIAREACPERQRERIVARAEEVGQKVCAATLARFPERPQLASDIGHAAHVELVARAACRQDVLAIVHAMAKLWETGFVLTAADERSVTIAIPALAS